MAIKYKKSVDELLFMGIEAPFANIGIGLILLGIMFLVVSAFHGSSDVKSGGGAVIFIGPIPIAIGTDKAWAVTALIVGIILYLVFFLSKGRM